MPEVMTAEETAAMAAMQADTVEIETPEPVAAPEPAPVAVPTEPLVLTNPVEPVKPPPGFVPQGALHEERERRKETDRKLEELQRQIEAMTKPPEPQIVVPDPVLEPEKFKQFQIDQIKARAEEIERLAKEQQDHRLERDFADRLNQDVGQYKTQTPDYDAAAQFAVKGRQEELAFYGYSEEQIAAQIETDLRALALQAYQKGKNPAELVYQYAKMRGYAGAAPPPVVDPAPATQIAAFAEAQRQTQSLAPVGGPSNDGGITLESLGKMSEKDMAKLPKAKRDEYMAKVMGG